MKYKQTYATYLLMDAKEFEMIIDSSIYIGFRKGCILEPSLLLLACHSVVFGNAISFFRLCMSYVCVDFARATNQE